MSESKLKEQLFSGMLWRTLERVCAQGVSFILTIILARILIPEDYGVVAILQIFMNIAYVFVINGFGEALVQAKHVEQKDFSTIFYCSLFWAFLLYAVLYLAAPAIAVFYGKEELTGMLRVFALHLPISAFNGIQHAYVQRNMQFRKFFMSTLGGTILSGIVGIILAYRGYGPWALIIQNLLNSVVDTVVLWFTVNCYPTLEFSAESARRHISYGWKLTAGALVNTIYEELRSLIIGKKYSASDLAFYNKGSQFSRLIVTNLNTALNSVLFPAFVKKNNSNDGIKDFLRKSIRISAYLIFPAMAGMGVTGQTLIELLLTEKWLACVPYLQIMCFYNAYVLITAIDNQAMKAIGRSDIYLKMALVRRAIYLAVLLLAMNKGVFAIAFTNVITVFIAFLVNGLFAKKYLAYSLGERLQDLLPSAILSLVMGAVVGLLGLLPMGSAIRFLIQVIVGIAVYWGLSEAVRMEGYLYLKSFLLDHMKKRRK